MQNSRVQLNKSLDTFSKKIAALGFDKYPKVIEDIPFESDDSRIRVKARLKPLKLSKSEMNLILEHHESAGRHETYVCGELVIAYLNYEFENTDVAYKITRYYTDEYRNTYPVQMDTLVVSSAAENYDYDRTWEDLHGVDEPESEFNFFAQCKG